MYTREEIVQEMTRIAQAPLTAEDMRKSRDAMLAAREDLAAAEESIRTASAQYSYMPASLRTAQLGQLYSALDAAKQKRRDTEKDFNEKLARGSHLEAIEHAQQEEGRKRQADEERQAAANTANEQETKTAFSIRYRAAGGTFESFEKVWPDLWLKELERRVLTGRNIEQEKLVKTGRYSLT